MHEKVVKVDDVPAMHEKVEHECKVEQTFCLVFKMKFIS